jgi:hypothetical protein
LLRNIGGNTVDDKMLNQIMNLFLDHVFIEGDYNSTLKQKLGGNTFELEDELRKIINHINKE